eukprot:TRINITY_DN32055_c0_g1_i3.p1 TRINITY_DN32055_c0_g1~~TRINITY_DN32055_c0_g1_i3.p1  ORF type:complete len:521 (+),score=70.77 TRINITY_DN32055_c0_g1_i3:125-1687(+)
MQLLRGGEAECKVAALPRPPSRLRPPPRPPHCRCESKAQRQLQVLSPAPSYDVSEADSDVPGNGAGRLALLQGSFDRKLEASIATEPDVKLLPLLKATAPKPVGRRPGRFSIRFVKSHVAQPLGISFRMNGRSGSVVVGAGMPHFGLCKGDEVVCVNDSFPASILQLQLLLKEALEIELTWQRKELKDNGCGDIAPVLRQSSMYNCVIRTTEDLISACTDPPTSEVSASDWPELDLLSCSSPLPLPNGPHNHRLIYIARTSLQQPFFLDFYNELCGESSGLTSPADRLAREIDGDDLVTLRTASREKVSSGEPTLQESAEELRQAMSLLDAAADAAAALAEEPPANNSLNNSYCNTDLPQQVLIVRDDLPQYGLQSGDELLAINDKRLLSAEHCRALLSTSLQIKLEFRSMAARPSVPRTISLSTASRMLSLDTMSTASRMLSLDTLESFCEEASFENFGSQDRSTEEGSFLGRLLKLAGVLDPCCAGSHAGSLGVARNHFSKAFIEWLSAPLRRPGDTS